MITIRPSSQRGHANHGWLDSHHTFSFGEYHDPLHMGFKSLRVINEDKVAAGQGFGKHPHSNMEILSYVVAGELSHRDSMGNVRTVNAGEVQAMSAGSGVTHSEFNPSTTTPAHFLQIWITPNKKDVAPSYSEWKATKPLGSLTLIASPDGSEGSIKINQDASVYFGNVKEKTDFSYALSEKRALWIQVISGDLTVNQVVATSGDGVAIQDESNLTLTTTQGCSFLLFDLI